MTELRFAWRALWRDLKSGELAILALALVVAVAAVSAVGFFTDRVERAMERQAGDILAADLVLYSRSEPDPGWLATARERGLRASQRWSFASVIVAGDGSVLANAKPVADGYPLRGAVRIADRTFGPQREATGIPERGTVWMDTRLFAQLGVEPGDTVRIGESGFTATAVLEYTPDEGFGFTSLAPALLMNLADIPATELIQPGSRVRYRYLFAGEPAEVTAFRAWLEERLERGQEIEDIDEARPEVGEALDRAGRFLGLAAVVAVLLAAIAVAMAARRYASRHLDPIAVIKCFGGTQRFVLRAYTLQVLMIGVLGSLAGLAIGWVAQYALMELVAGMLTLDELPTTRPFAAFAGIGAGIVVLLGFALPPLLPLRKVPPARVLRRDLDPPPLSSWIAYGLAIAAVGALLFAQTRDLEPTAWLAAGFATTAVLLALGAWALLKLLGRLRGRVGVAWRYGMANIARRRRESVAQMVAFGLGIMVLLLLGIVRTDLMSGWQQMLSEDAPNHFLINIQTDERGTVERVFEDAGVPVPNLWPMVRARMTHIRGTPVEKIEFANENARWFVDREHNLSWSAEPQTDNRIVDGEWWTPERHGEPLVSIELERAQRMDLAIGDTLTFDIAGESIELTVANFRTVEWDSFNPNFFLVLPPGVLDGLPATWVGAAYVPRADRGVMLDLLRAVPTVTVIDIEAILEQVRQVVSQASRAVEFVFLFTLLSGVIVMLAAVNASREERLRESAMLRAFGAERGTVLQGLASEFVTLGALSGLLAAVTASATGWVLAERVFEFTYTGSPWIWVFGLVGGAGGVGLIGLLATRRVLDQPPMGVLNRG